MFPERPDLLCNGTYERPSPGCARCVGYATTDRANTPATTRTGARIAGSRALFAGAAWRNKFSEMLDRSNWCSIGCGQHFPPSSCRALREVVMCERLAELREAIGLYAAAFDAALLPAA